MMYKSVYAHLSGLSLSLTRCLDHSCTEKAAAYSLNVLNCSVDSGAAAAQQ
jgi:hypothetical protein